MYGKPVHLALVVAMVLVLSSAARAKYGGFAGEIFFGRHPDAAGAARGKAGVTSSGDITNTFYNPAGLADARGVGFCVSWQEEDGLLRDRDYRFIGGNVQIGHYGALGISRYNFVYEGVGYAVGNGGRAGAVATDASIVVLTLAGEPVEDLLVGANISSFGYDFTVDRGRSHGSERAYWADAGVIKYFTLGRTQASGHWLKAGASLSNLTYSEIEVAGEGEDLPVVLRLGAAYEMGWWGLTWKQGLRTVETILRVEYQDILNYERLTGVRIGGEVRLIEILALRLGYYSETAEAYGQDGERERIEETTYGFGIALPAHKLTAGRLPLGLKLDVVNLKQPRYTGAGDTEPLTTITFCANYYF